MTSLERAKAGIAQAIGVSATPIESFAVADGRMISTAGLIRAVLQAIREPGANVTEAGNDIQHPDDCTDVARIWQAMIDAALEEE